MTGGPYRDREPREREPERVHPHTATEAVPHCTTCICGRRAPVQGDWRGVRGPGSIAWAEHLLAHGGYASHGHSQSAERIAERGGFSYGELVEFLGREPKTWKPRR